MHNPSCNEGIIVCPVCGEKLSKAEKAWSCVRGHSFDIAHEGYVNLLRKGGITGDNTFMTRARHGFLSKGYYAPLADALCSVLRGTAYTTVLDICCGEGYYTERLAAEATASRVYGFDISREMIKTAAKRPCAAEFFVAGLSAIPVMSHSVGLAVHLFAPFREDEFARVLSQDGTLISVIPGASHLAGLKAVLYDTIYLNDEKPPETPEGLLKLVDKQRVSGRITVTGRNDIDSLFRMTPYFYKTPPQYAERLAEIEELETEYDFILLFYKKA